MLILSIVRKQILKKSRSEAILSSVTLSSNHYDFLEMKQLHQRVGLTIVEFSTSRTLKSVLRSIFAEIRA